jgi:IPT/TIG domain/Fibronectin type III domain
VLRPRLFSFIVTAWVVLAISGTCVLGLAATAEAAPTSLVLSQSAAFSIIGHSCGGIQEKPYATGFASGTGYPTGVVYMSTRCGGSGHAGGGSTLYSAWANVTWDFTSAVVSYARTSTTPTVNPTLVVYDSHGNELYNQGTAGVVNGTQVSSQAYLVLAPGFMPAPRVTGISTTRGPSSGGTSVTITGTGFTGATSVNFAGTPDTSITVTGDTSITLATPPSTAGTDDVTVTGPGGSSADSAAFQFTFVPAPVVTLIDPSNGPVAGGNSITITGSGLTYVSSVTFGDQAAGFTVNGDTSITAFIPASDSGVDNVGVTVSSIGGASLPLQYSYTAVASGTPGAPTIGTATAGDTVATVNFTAPASDGGSPITSYTATSVDGTNPANGGQSATGASSPLTVTGLTNGDSYTFTVAAANTNGPGPASGTSNAVVPVSSGPGPLAITTATLPDATRGMSYRTALQASGGATPYRWRKVGDLPKGFKLRSNGTLSGKPNAKRLAPGMYAITVEVMTRHTKAGPSQTAEATLTLTVL